MVRNKKNIAPIKTLFVILLLADVIIIKAAFIYNYSCDYLLLFTALLVLIVRFLNEGNEYFEER